MKKFKLLIVPSDNDDELFSQFTSFDEAFVEADKGESTASEFSFDTEQEREVFVQGYLAGIGYLGSGLYFTKDTE